MHGPEPRGPTFARRVRAVVKVAAGACALIGMLVAFEAWRFLERSANPHFVNVSGRVEARPPAPAQSASQRLAAREGTREGARDGTAGGATIEQAIAASAFVVIDLSTGRAVREQKSEWLDTPVWPGSIAKLATFAAAIDAGALTESTRVMCTRELTLAGGRRVACTHPRLGHPLSPVEALAHSCNFFTGTIARNLTREQLSGGFVRMGLSPVPADADLITSAFGLGGAQVAPRKLIQAVRRAANIPLIRDGLRASARTGTSSAFADAGIDALAKTGTAPMRGGRALGLVSAITPAGSPRFGIVVALPGGSGAQAAETAAAILRSTAPSGTATSGTKGTSGVAGSANRGKHREPSARASAQDRASHRQPARLLWSSASGGRSYEVQRRSAREDSGAAVRTGAVPAAAAVVRVGQPTERGYAVETLDVEEYVARVVAGETSDATPDAAREALAIAARTFASVNRGRHAGDGDGDGDGDGFDVCTLTHCQVTRRATRSSRAAASATRGLVLVDGRDGRPAPVFYSASCGGTMADARTLLPNVDPATMPWLASRPDPAGIEEVTWRTDIPADDLLRALQQSGSRGDALRNLIVHASAGAGAGEGAAARIGRSSGSDSSDSRAERNRTPRPSTPANLGRGRDTGFASEASRGSASASGSGSRAGSSPDSSGRRDPRAAGDSSAWSGPAIVTHVTTEGLTPSTLPIDAFRRAIGQQLGWQFLKSTRFTVQRTSRGYRFTGSGHGHGVGLCVFGASALALRGHDAARILDAYFPGLQPTIPGSRPLSRTASPIPTQQSARSAISAPDAAATSIATTINLRLSSRDEGERARLLRLIAANLKELALDLSLPSPPTLDVVVHPTTAAYRRATRSSSWTSAATIMVGDGITLHFAPLETLDRGAVLTKTIRHELVHVLTIRALFERPRWVHEGLALHLAGERVSAEPDETSGDDVKCPSDRDLMRPRSRDAFDRAYSRAAACVARDLASGRNWRDLGAR